MHLRPSTTFRTVALIVALGKAAEIAVRNHVKRQTRWQQIRQEALAAFQTLGGIPALSAPVKGWPRPTCQPSLTIQHNEPFSGRTRWFRCIGNP